MAENHPHTGRPAGDGSPQDPTYDRAKRYIGGTDKQGHSGQMHAFKIQPWLKDLLGQVSHEIPAYKGQEAAAARNYITHGIRYDLETLEDSKRKEQLQREFQLHLDMEDQSRQLIRFNEMHRYVDSCRVVLPVYAQSGNWMLVTKELERMRKRLADGLLWEPHRTHIAELIVEYEKKMKALG